ncbi:MAG: hypothetical protein AAFY71_06105 [Bacteroidota bacterium]
MNKFVFLSLFIFFSSFCFAQTETLSLPWSSLGEWTAESPEESESETTWMLSSDAGVSMRFTEYKEVLTLSADQAMRGLMRSAQPDYPKGKMSILEKHSGFDSEFEYVLFSIEGKYYEPTGKPRSSMYMVVMGDEHTYVLTLSLEVAKFSGKDKKRWISFFKQGSLVEKESGEVFAQM